MKKSQSSTWMLALGLLACSCSTQDMEYPTRTAVEQSRALTFTLKMPAGGKISYTRADGEMIHDETEYAINHLSLYEYEVGADSSEKLVRILKSNGNGKNVIDLTDRGSDNSYTISISVPAEYIGKDYRYRFVANDVNLADPESESDFTSFSIAHATRELLSGNSADALSGSGIAMSGTASDGVDDVITIAEGTSCTVDMQRIVSRIDLRYETPNLKVTSMELRNAPRYGFLFKQGAIPSFADEDCITLGHHASVQLPENFLKDLEEDESGRKPELIELEKAFYLYERANGEYGSAMVHIEYEVDYNDKVDAEGNKVYYHGSIDVPFSKADGTFVDAERNHRYVIVLGNGKEPVAGEIKFRFVVEDWQDVAISDEFTSDDPEI